VRAIAYCVEIRSPSRVNCVAILSYAERELRGFMQD
jgi:hypothetical protein